MTRIAPMKLGLVRHGTKVSAVSYASATSGSAALLVGLAMIPVLVCRIELVGESRSAVPGTPMSQLLTGLTSPAAPMPVTVAPACVPARLSQKMLLNSSGLLNSGEPTGSPAWRRVLLAPVDSPAGAGWPSLVAAVAVVTFFMIVLL